MSSVLFTKLWYYYTPYITICTPFLFPYAPLLCSFRNLFFYDSSDCFALRTLAILHNIRISRRLRTAFMLISQHIFYNSSDCFALRSLAILHNIRISHRFRAAFMLISQHIFLIPRIASRFALSQSYTIFAYRIASVLLLCSLLWHVNKSLNHLCASTCGL